MTFYVPPHMRKVTLLPLRPSQKIGSIGKEEPPQMETKRKSKRMQASQSDRGAPLSWTELGAIIYDPRHPIESTAGHEVFQIAELVEIIAEQLNARDIVRNVLINKKWQGVVKSPRKSLRLILGTESEQDVFDPQAYVDSRATETVELAVNPLIFHHPGDDNEEAAFFRADPCDPVLGDDSRLEAFICDPPTADVEVHFEFYYFSHPTRDWPAHTITVVGHRPALVAGGVRYKHIRAIFEEEKEKAAKSGRQVFTDVLRSYVTTYCREVVFVPNKTAVEAKKLVKEGMPEHSSDYDYVVLYNGREIDSREEVAHAEGWSEHMQSTEVDGQVEGQWFGIQ